MFTTAHAAVLQDTTTPDSGADLGSASLRAHNRAHYPGPRPSRPQLQIDVEELLAKEMVTIHFQPLVSVKRRAVLGYEALARGVRHDGTIISPADMFGTARSMGLQLELDRLCRKKALEAFAPIHTAKRDVMLFMNMDTSVLDTSVVGSGILMDTAKRCGINPNNIILELIESNAPDTGSLVKFISTYRDKGFLIALDDIGAGHSNLERVSFIKPEVIKIDRSLISCLDSEYYKTAVVKSLVDLAHSIGALVVGEGVERLEEVIHLMEMGVDVFQGYHFAHPGPGPDNASEAGQKLNQAASAFKSHVIGQIQQRETTLRAFDTSLNTICTELSKAGTMEIDRILAIHIQSNPKVECLYVLDSKGRQISNTICNPYRVSENKRLIYQPAHQGADHSLKAYYLPIKAGLQETSTEPYISLASGNTCVTRARQVCTIQGDSCILCMDVAVN